MRTPGQQRERRHGTLLEPPSRRELERSGWRTTLDFRENHVRGLDGRLLRVEPVWIAEAERYVGHVEFATAEGSSEQQAWDRLAGEISVSNVQRTQRVRIAR